MQSVRERETERTDTDTHRNMHSNLPGRRGTSTPSNSHLPTAPPKCRHGHGLGHGMAWAWGGTDPSHSCPPLPFAHAIPRHTNTRIQKKSIRPNDFFQCLHIESPKSHPIRPFTHPFFFVFRCSRVLPFFLFFSFLRFLCSLFFLFLFLFLFTTLLFPTFFTPSLTHSLTHSFPSLHPSFYLTL